MEVTTWDLLDVPLGEVIEVNAKRYRFVTERVVLGSRSVVLNPEPPLPVWVETYPARQFTQQEDRFLEVK